MKPKKSNRGRYQPSNEAADYLSRTTGSWHVKDGRLTFGKYKGELLKQILKVDRSYITWACENISGFDSNLPTKKKSKKEKPSSAKPCQPPPSQLVKEVLRRIEEKDMHMPENFEPNQFTDDDAPPW